MDLKPDPHLQTALRHAPDRDLAPPPGLSERILAQARAAAPVAARPVPPGWVERCFGWMSRPALAGALGSVLVAGFVGLMWREGPPPEAMPEASRAPAPAAPPSPAERSASIAGVMPESSPAPAPAAPPAAATPPAAPSARTRSDESRVAMAPSPAPPAAPTAAPAPPSPAPAMPAPASPPHPATDTAGRAAAAPPAAAARDVAAAPVPAAAPAAAPAVAEAVAAQKAASPAPMLSQNQAPSRPAARAAATAVGAAAFDPLVPALLALTADGDQAWRQRLQALQRRVSGPWAEAPPLPAGSGEAVTSAAGRTLGRLLVDTNLVQWQGDDGQSWRAPLGPAAGTR
ncbi:MAG: hypothetical protein U1F56_04715 [Rubrivivax sp.]